MDMLEEAIVITFNESASTDSELKAQAVAYCQQIKETPNICRICIEKLRFCKLLQVQFWCLQTLNEFVRVKYSSMGSEDKDFLRKSLLSIACLEDENVGVLEAPAFIKNKLAQVFVTLIYFEYPMAWSSVFVHFLPNFSKGVAVIDMFCRVLNALDDELLSLDDYCPRTPDKVKAAVRVKFAMRKQCVGQIVRAWYDIVSLYRNSNHELCSGVLDTMRRYISWIDIGLIANDVFIPLLFELVLLDQLSDQLRCAATGCLLAIISKRMEPRSKLSLLESLQIDRVLGLIDQDSDSDLVSGIASLLTGYATEVLECSERLKTSAATKQATAKLLDEVLPSVFFYAARQKRKLKSSLVQLFSTYVATMEKTHLRPLKEKDLLLVDQILEVIRTQVRYDPLYRDNLDVKDKVGSEEEDRMAEYRKDFFVLLRSVGQAAPDVTLFFIRNSLSSAVGSSSSPEEVEAALSMFNALGGAQGSAVLNELVPMLLSTKFPCHSNRLVALVYLGTITSYLNFIQDNTHYIPLFLEAFLDERGIRHPNPNVSRNASHLYMKLAKLLKSNLVPRNPTGQQPMEEDEDQVAQDNSVPVPPQESADLLPKNDNHRSFHGYAAAADASRAGDGGQLHQHLLRRFTDLGL